MYKFVCWRRPRSVSLWQRTAYRDPVSTLVMSERPPLFKNRGQWSEEHLMLDCSLSLSLSLRCLPEDLQWANPCGRWTFIGTVSGHRHHLYVFIQHRKYILWPRMCNSSSWAHVYCKWSPASPGQLFTSFNLCGPTPPLLIKSSHMVWVFYEVAT